VAAAINYGATRLGISPYLSHFILNYPVDDRQAGDNLQEASRGEFLA
jgi:hypothetical protein